uniref:Uncharacterized protein n=1 Tax=Meloidogyne enterolobii TaxID=390850 RepID=A0A6V7U1T9_MELEN|nr:unnamed protein product [Meloidogyne enterolobii]
MNNLEIPEFNPLIPPPILELNKSLEMKDSPILELNKSLEMKDSPKIIKELSNKSNEKKLFSKSSKEKSQTLTHLWKLTKGKTVLQYHLCYDCQKRLFNSQDKIIRQGDKIILKIEFCEKCALDNCQATDLLSNKPKRKYKKVEDKMDN